MTFFENQIAAKRKTKLLVVYFLCAIVSIILAIYGVVLLGMSQGTSSGALPTLWNPEIFLAVAALTLLVILLGSLYKIFLLRGGGAVVAESLGGQQIDPSTTDPAERQLLNIVEEIAIASGTSVPPVYLIDEDGINAFAAGYHLDDAVIGVTRGCMNLLNRAELQGVIAHEFSHIIHGDMRLNIRLIGILHGILLIALIGYSILRGSAGRRVYRRSSNSKNNKGGALAFGVALLVIGYIGVFFGNLIKAAVSRQREFLADASAVQFTRDPSGISGALKKIGGFVRGSRLTNPKAEEVSHMLFAEGVKHFLGGLLATHPPLSTRIARIDPTFKGEYQQITDERVAELTAQQHSTGEQSLGLHTGQAIKNAPESISMKIDEDTFTQSIGTMSASHLAYAQDLIASLPLRIYQELRSTTGAQVIIYLLLFDKDVQDVQNTQREYLLENLSNEFTTRLKELEGSILSLDTSLRLPLIDLCLPALKQLSQNDIATFQRHLKVLVETDQALSLFEYMLHHILERHVTHQANPLSYKRSSLSQQAHAAAEIISMLAFVGHDSSQTQQEAFEKGLFKLKVEGQHSHTPQEPSLDALDEALRTLWSADEGIKERTIRAAVTTINSDGKVTQEEAEILRTVGDALGCPVPPLVSV